MPKVHVPINTSIPILNHPSVLWTLSRAKLLALLRWDCQIMPHDWPVSNPPILI